MDDKSYNELRAELLYDHVIENLLSLIVSHLNLKYSEVEEKKWQKIPKQLILLKELRPSLFLEKITPELNPYTFSKESIHRENQKKVSREWKFLAPLNMNGQKFLKTKSNYSNKYRTVDASPLVIGAMNNSFKIYTDFFDMVTFEPFTEKNAGYWVECQRKEWENPTKEEIVKIKGKNYSKKMILPKSVTVFDSYYVNCANLELLKVKKLVNTISKDKYFHQSYPLYQAIDGSQIPVNDFRSIHSYYIKLKKIVIEHRTLPWMQSKT